MPSPGTIFSGLLAAIAIPATATAEDPQPTERAAAAPAPSDPEAAPETYKPVVSFDVGKWHLEAPILVASRYEGATSYVLDRQGTSLEPHAMNNLIRLGARIDAKDAILPFLLFAEYEHDVITGTIFGEPEVPGGGVGYFATDELDHAIRKAYGRVSVMQYLHAMGGIMTSHWGLGLVANDGAGDWAPGNASFTDKRGGDRVIRGMLASGPHTRRHNLFAAVGFDSVLDDDVFYPGDKATQIVAAFVYGRDKPNTAGAYYVRRGQESDRGRTTDVNVVDVTGQVAFALGDSLDLKFEAEGAYIFGDTTLGPTPDFQEHKVRQLGIAARATADAGFIGGVLDFLYASGDGNIDDETQSGFKVDRNYPMGLLLYRHLVAGQTGRSPVSASNPDILGFPPEDVDRFSTRGNITGTLAFFPRVFVRPVEGLEIYGGALFAFATASLIDPFNTRKAGGDPRNALDGKPGDYLGTEIDVGVRYRTLLAGTELTVGLEGGALLPGAAFADAAGTNHDSLLGGRALLRYRL